MIFQEPFGSWMRTVWNGIFIICENGWENSQGLFVNFLDLLKFSAYSTFF